LLPGEKSSVRARAAVASGPHQPFAGCHPFGSGQSGVFPAEGEF
jgi:hypothetical protein